MPRELTIRILQTEAAAFARIESTYPEPTLFGVNDGKRVGTYLEQKFQAHLHTKYEYAPATPPRALISPAWAWTSK